MTVRKNIILAACVFTFLCGCTYSGYTYDKNYGVLYTTDDEGITIKLDRKREDLVTAVYISSYGVGDPLQNISAEWNQQLDADAVDKAFVTYIIIAENEDGTSNEYIVLNLYKDGFDYESAQPLIDYLGLSNELKDHQLYYQKELLRADTFRYKSIIENGSFSNNISLDGNPAYDYSSK